MTGPISRSPGTPCGSYGRSPGFFCIVVLTPRLGIGANTPSSAWWIGWSCGRCPYKDPEQMHYLEGTKSGENSETEFSIRSLQKFSTTTNVFFGQTRLFSAV